MKILMLTCDAAGNWPPELHLLKLLVARGHHVRVVSHPNHAGPTTAVGATYEPYGVAKHPDVQEKLPAIDQPGRALRGWLLNASFGEELWQAIGRERPDVVLIDPMLRMAFPVAEQAGIPVVFLAHTLFGAGAGQNQLAPPILDGLTQQRRSLGLAPLPDALAHAETAAAILCFSWRDLDREPIRGVPQLYHVGPLLEGGTDSFETDWGDSSNPLVLVSFSTSFQNQVEPLQRIIDALSSLPVRGLVTLGQSVSPDDFAPSPNVKLVEFVPHAAAMPASRLVITHAGHGTVVAAATYGIPLLCLPQGRDQPMVAEGARRAGVAHVIAPEAGVEGIRAAVVAALADEGLAARCRAFAASQDLAAGRRLAVDVVEALARG